VIAIWYNNHLIIYKVNKYRSNIKPCISMGLRYMAVHIEVPSDCW